MKISIAAFLLLISMIQINAQAHSDSIEINKDNDSKKIIGISFHTGYYLAKNDIRGNGLGLGLRLHFPVNSTMSLRLNYFVSSATGISHWPWFHRSVPVVGDIGGGLVEDIYEPYKDNPEGWFPSYRFTQYTFEVEGLMNLTKIMNKQFDMDFDDFDLYMIGSYGIFRHRTELDLLDSEGSAYTNLITKTAWTHSKVDTEDGRKDIRDKLSNIYDGKYETEYVYPIKNNTYSYGAGLRFKVTQSVNLGFEYKVIKYNNFDYADGIRFRTEDDLTREDDSGRYSSLFIEIKY